MVPSDSYMNKLFTAWEEAEANMHRVVPTEPRHLWDYPRSHYQPVTRTSQPANEIRDPKKYKQVFQQYLQICNRAIEQNRHKFPYTEIWNARFKALKGEATLHALVYDDQPKASFMLQLTPGMKIRIVEKKNIPAEGEWPFTYQYLKQVADNPEEYIANPAKLEWGWLRTIFGST